MIKIFPTTEQVIIDWYVTNGLSAREIKEKLSIEVSTRQIQRILKRAGVIRTAGEAFSLAVSQGKVTYHRKPDHLKKKRTSLPVKQRSMILARDAYRCVLCGATVEQGLRLEINHINGDTTDNKEENLRTLCNLCNKGEQLEGETE